MAIAVELARAIRHSWQAGFGVDSRDALTLYEIAVALRRLAAARGVPDVIRCKRAEGFAYYAVYPEAYLVAAERARMRAPGPRRAIGIRSIGTALAALIGAATDGTLPATVRPRGEPFRRELAVAPRWFASGSRTATRSWRSPTRAPGCRAARSGPSSIPSRTAACRPRGSSATRVTPASSPISRACATAIAGPACAATS